MYVWQFLFVMPLILASGYIGFAQYAAYLVPAAAATAARSTRSRSAVGVVTLLSLYRTIPHVARTALVLGAVAVLTLARRSRPAASLHPAQTVGALLAPAFSPHGLGIAGFGAALVITLYDYAGYNDVCQLGDEVIAPVRTIRARS